MTASYFIFTESGNKIYETYTANAHRDNGPAMIGIGYEMWLKNGKLHRTDGPAYLSFSRISGETILMWWYLNGNRLTEDEFKEAISSL